jgi:hypothetical protein
LIALVLGVPYLAYQAYKNASRTEMIVDAITFSNSDFQLVLQLARQNPLPGDWTPLSVEEVPELPPPNFDGFRLITDTRIIDMRAWRPGMNDDTYKYISYRRMQVRRVAPRGEDGGGEQHQGGGKFRIQQFALTPDASVRCDTRELRPILRKAPHVAPSAEEGYMYELEFDLSSVPEGQDFEFGFEVTVFGLQDADAENKFVFPIVAPTDVATLWALLPPGHPYRSFEVVGDDRQSPASVEAVDATYEFHMFDGSLFGWMLVAPRDDYQYECRWTWRGP